MTKGQRKKKKLKIKRLARVFARFPSPAPLNSFIVDYYPSAQRSFYHV
jgi:hypothetical protein